MKICSFEKNHCFSEVQVLKMAQMVFEFYFLLFVTFYPMTIVSVADILSSTFWVSAVGHRICSFVYRVTVGLSRPPASFPQKCFSQSMRAVVWSVSLNLKQAPQ